MKTGVLRSSILVAALLLLLAFHTSEQDNTLLTKIKDKLTAYVTTYGPEKTYLQTDKDFYKLGDTLWFKTYVVDGISHKESGKSHVAYVELLNRNDSIVAKRKLFVEGKSAAGDIVIDAFIPEGIYRLRAFTNYMLNDTEAPLFEKRLAIGNKKNSAKTKKGNTGKKIVITRPDSLFDNEVKGGIGLRFFPEGGHLVDGLPSVLGIQAMDSLGNGLPLKGSIHSGDGTVVKQFNSAEFGLGKVNFTPKPNETYYASVRHYGGESRFKMPTPLKSGYGLNVRNRDNEILVQVSTTADLSLDGTLLLGHLRGNIILEHIGKPDDKRNYAVKVLTEQLPSGVASFTLFTPSGEPVCERLVFIDRSDNKARAFLKTNTKIFSTREKVDLDLTLEDENGTPILGDFSVSVTSVDNQSEAQPFAIKSWLLLDSDLGGTVKNPDFFFKDASKNTQSQLDILMLTQGWKRFVWKDLIEKKANTPFNFEPEKGIMITGTLTTLKKKYSIKNALVTLNVLDRLFEDRQRTDSEARFHFGPYVFNDTLNAVLQAANPNTDSNTDNTNRTIELDPAWPSAPIRHKPIFTGKSLSSNMIDELSYEGTMEIEANSKVTRLQGVTVKTRKKPVARRINDLIDKTTPYGRPSLRIFKDSVPGSESLSVLELIARKNGGFRNAPISISFSASPVVTVDGALTDFDAIRDMRANEVKFIDMVKGYSAGATIYGSRGSSGAIAIYTNLPSEVESLREKSVVGITTARIPGFYRAKKFHSPNYSQKTAMGSENEHDSRTTLLWEPRVILQKKGTSRLKFYTSDISGRYTIRLEGIANNGKLIQGTYEFRVDP